LSQTLHVYHLAVVAFQNREITQNSDKIWPYSSSRSSRLDCAVFYVPANTV